MTTHGGGENVNGALAPVIPLFGGTGGRREATHADGPPSPRHPAGKALRGSIRRLPVGGSAGEEDSPGGAGRGRRSDGDAVSRAHGSLASDGDDSSRLADEWHPAWTADPRETDAGAARDAAHPFGDREARNGAADAPGGGGQARGRRGFGARSVSNTSRGDTTENTEPPAREALDWLLRALRRKPISVSEARRELTVAGYDDVARDAAIDECLRLGYLDDARLAEQLTYIGAERKRQGRSAIARTLAERGIDRSVSEEALDPLAADEGERAREFADKKARAMGGLPRDVALRRLVGQLSRRGFGTVALDVARAALDDAASPDGPDAG